MQQPNGAPAVTPGADVGAEVALRLQQQWRAWMLLEQHARTTPALRA
jgi:hypothetical protein